MITEYGTKITNLTGPKRNEGAEGETRLGALESHLLPCSAKGSGESTGGRGLDLDLEHLKGAEGNVGENFSGGGTGEPNGGLVLVGKVLAGKVHVEVLEHFIETVLEHALERVADESGSEALPDTGSTLLSKESLETVGKTAVLGGVNLFRDGQTIFTARMSKFCTCMLHLATSRGVIPAWVIPQARTPPSMHLA